MDLSTTLNTLNIGFDDYTINDVSYTEHIIRYRSFSPAGVRTGAGQILITNEDGTYGWSQEVTLQGLQESIATANTIANQTKTRVDTLEQTTATKTYVDNLIVGSLQGAY